VLGQHVHEGHYDLVGPDGDIILPQVWEWYVKPGLAITMHMWPMPEPPRKSALLPPPPMMMPMTSRTSKKAPGKKKINLKF